MERYEHKSEFAKRLEADPELRARCEELVKELREDDEDFIAMRKSRQLTADDYSVIINARADDYSFR